MTIYNFNEISGLELPFDPAADQIVFPQGVSAGALVITESIEGFVILSYGPQEVVLLGASYAQLLTTTFTFAPTVLGAPVARFGTANADVMTGAAAGDYLEGGGGADSINASQGGIDRVSGGAGDDFITMGAAFTSLDRIDGGAGRDTVALTGAYAVNLRDTFVNIETLRLGAGFDYAIRTVAATVTAGQTMTIVGTTLGAGDAIFFDGAASAGNFVVFGGGANDDIATGAGADIVDAYSGGADRISTGAGNDEVRMRGTWTASDRIFLGAGYDTLVLTGLGAGAPALITTTILSGLDKLLLSGAADYVFTIADGVMDAAAPAGPDPLIDARGIAAGFSADIDLSQTSLGELTFYGSAGDDVFRGGSSSDLISETLGGVDQFHGGAGADVFVLGSTYTDADLIFGDAGQDALRLAGDYSAAVLAMTNVRVDQLVLSGGSFHIVLADSAELGVINASALTAAQSLIFDATAETSLSVLNVAGGAGADTLIGSGGNDQLSGGLGDDVLHGGLGNDVLAGGGGDDFLLGGDGVDNLSDALGGGGATLDGGAGTDVLVGGSGDDIFIGGVGAENMNTNSGGSDTFVYRDISEGGDIIFGAFGADDSIDLSLIDADANTAGDDAFTFIGSAAFSGTAGELRLFGNSLMADVNGDGIADFGISINVDFGGYFIL